MTVTDSGAGSRIFSSDFPLDVSNGINAAPATPDPFADLAFSLTVPGDSSKVDAYVESSLLSAEEKTLSVIVTAKDSQTAARAVERAGGSVTSDLWLINAVSANVPTEKINSLAKFSGVKSIVSNKTVDSADGEDCDPTQGPCSPVPGWITNRYVKNTKSLLAGMKKKMIRF